MKRLVLCVCLLSLLGCAAAPRRPEVKPLSSEATDLFAAIEKPGLGASLVVDLEALRARGLLPLPAERGTAYSLIDLIVQAAPNALLIKPDWTEPMAKFLVSAALLDRSTKWPDVRRVGIFLPGTSWSEVEGGSEDLEKAVLLVSVDGNATDARELLRTWAVIAKACEATTAAGDQASDDGAPRLTFDQPADDLLCVKEQEGEDGMKVCLRGSDGVYALGSRSALDALSSLAGQPTTTSGRALFFLGSPEEIQGEKANLTLFLRGDAALDAGLTLEASNETMLQEMAQVLRLVLAQRNQALSALEEATADEIRRLQAALSGDGQASQALKDTAAALTVASLFDRYGTAQGADTDLKVEQTGNLLQLTKHLTAAEVDRQIATSDGFASLRALVMLGAATFTSVVAVEVFQKEAKASEPDQDAKAPDLCQTKQLEARMYLEEIAQKQFDYANKNEGRWGVTLGDIGFDVDVTLYTYCMNGSCIACTAGDCRPATPSGGNPCDALTADEGDFRACAYANLSEAPDQAESLDVWTVTSSGTPTQVTNGCP